MPREKFSTLTEQMFYILLCLQNESSGVDIMSKVREITNERVTVGAGTLYTLLESFLKTEMIRETSVEGRKRNYIITELGTKVLQDEKKRLEMLVQDFNHYIKKEV